MKRTKSRYSKQRHLIFETVKKLQNHPNAEDIYESVKVIEPRISLGTVYRNLNWLVSHKKIRAIHVPDGPCRYDACMTDHYHIRCIMCGRMEDVRYWGSKKIKLERELDTTFEVLGFTLEFIGICAECKSTTGDQATLSDTLVHSKKSDGDMRNNHSLPKNIY